MTSVTTRQIKLPKGLGATLPTIRILRQTRKGCNEEMIRETLSPLLDALDGLMLSSVSGFADLLHLYYDTMLARPEFPKLILKVLALNQGARAALYPAIARAWAHGAARKVVDLKTHGQIAPTVDPDMS